MAVSESLVFFGMFTGSFVRFMAEEAREAEQPGGAENPFRDHASSGGPRSRECEARTNRARA